MERDKKIKLKVCGMKYPGNISEVAAVEPDYMGFIFYPPSKRYVGEDLDLRELEATGNIEKVGVFVNEQPERIFELAARYGFKHVQLHGDESPETCRQIKDHGLKVIKAIQVGEEFSSEEMEKYKGVVDYFLLDTKSSGYGGSGRKFDWSLLKNYDNEVPLFLSGGIDVEDAEAILALEDLNIHAIDVNSRFEKVPAVKDAQRILEFKQRMKL